SAARLVEAFRASPETQQAIGVAVWEESRVDLVGEDGAALHAAVVAGFDADGGLRGRLTFRQFGSDADEPAASLQWMTESDGGYLHLTGEKVDTNTFDHAYLDWVAFLERDVGASQPATTPSALSPKGLSMTSAIHPLGGGSEDGCHMP